MTAKNFLSCTFILYSETWYNICELTNTGLQWKIQTRVFDWFPEISSFAIVVFVLSSNAVKSVLPIISIKTVIHGCVTYARAPPDSSNLMSQRSFGRAGFELELALIAFLGFWHPSPFDWAFDLLLPMLWASCLHRDGKVWANRLFQLKRREAYIAGDLWDWWHTDGHCMPLVQVDPEGIQRSITNRWIEMGHPITFPIRNGHKT